jgi:hypothetical protein
MTSPVPAAPQEGDVPQAIRDLLVTGTKLRRNLMSGHTELWHVRAVIDDDWIVFRTYDRKTGWVYFCADIIMCYMSLANGGLTLK